MTWDDIVSPLRRSGATCIVVREGTPAGAALFDPRREPTRYTIEWEWDGEPYEASVEQHVTASTILYGDGSPVSKLAAVVDEAVTRRMRPKERR